MKTGTKTKISKKQSSIISATKFLNNLKKRVRHNDVHVFTLAILYPTISLSSGYLNTSFVCFPPIESKSDTNPTRPINLNKIMTHSLTVDKPYVIPIDMPHVPNALVTSNITAPRPNLDPSTKAIIHTPINTKNIAIASTTNALSMS